MIALSDNKSSAVTLLAPNFKMKSSIWQFVNQQNPNLIYLMNKIRCLEWQLIFCSDTFGPKFWNEIINLSLFWTWEWGIRDNVHKKKFQIKKSQANIYILKMASICIYVDALLMDSSNKWLEWYLPSVTFFLCPEGFTEAGQTCISSRYSQIWIPDFE